MLLIKMFFILKISYSPIITPLIASCEVKLRILISSLYLNWAWKSSNEFVTWLLKYFKSLIDKSPITFSILDPLSFTLTFVLNEASDFLLKILRLVLNRFRLKSKSTKSSEKSINPLKLRETFSSVTEDFPSNIWSLTTPLKSIFFKS